MLLRSSSTPTLKAYACQLLHEANQNGFSPIKPSCMSLQRTSSGSELKLCSAPVDNGKEKMIFKTYVRSPIIIEEKEEKNICDKIQPPLLSYKVVVVSEGGGLDGSGGACSGGNGGESWGSSSHNGPDGSEGMDVYYQGMIKIYPGDSLLLANYAKFLKEVRRDNVKAEEICKRAILANGNDGNVLSMYGDLVWQNHQDSHRASTYFDQAVRSSPQDCYVLASYAKFLWDVPDEEDEENGKEVQSSQCSSLDNIIDSTGCTPLSISF